MDKQEILERSRKSGLNELEKSIDEKASSYGLIAILALTLIFMLYKMFNKLPYQDMSSLFFAQVSAAGFYKFVKLKRGLSLVVGIVCGLTAILYALTYMLGW